MKTASPRSPPTTPKALRLPPDTGKPPGGGRAYSEPGMWLPKSRVSAPVQGSPRLRPFPRAQSFNPALLSRTSTDTGGESEPGEEEASEEVSDSADGELDQREEQLQNEQQVSCKQKSVLGSVPVSPVYGTPVRKPETQVTGTASSAGSVGNVNGRSGDHGKGGSAEASAGGSGGSEGLKAGEIGRRKRTSLLRALHVKPRGLETEELSMCEELMYILCSLLVILTFPFSLFWCMKVVNEFERVVVFRLGRLVSHGALGPGLIFINPFMDEMIRVDQRTMVFDVPPQEILTRDSVAVCVDAIVYYYIDEPCMSVVNVKNVHGSTHLLAVSLLRNILGAKILAELLMDRDGTAQTMRRNLDDETEEWGVKVDRVEIKNVLLPASLQRAMAAEAEASRGARAKMIAAEGEKKASLALKRAADVITESPGTLQLRYLQTLSTISASSPSTVVFPLPMEMLQSFGGKNRMTVVPRVSGGFVI